MNHEAKGQIRVKMSYGVSSGKFIIFSRIALKKVVPTYYNGEMIGDVVDGSLTICQEVTMSCHWRLA